MTLRSTVLGLTRDERHVYTWNDGRDVLALPSVTTVIGVVDKSGPLIGWAKRITAEAAVAHHDEIAGWIEMSGRDGAVGLLTKAATQKRDAAADVGARVHELAEAVSRGDHIEAEEEVAPYIAAYRQFQADYRPQFLALEEMACSLTHGYAGTLDSIAVIDGAVWMLDNKTSKGVYPETGMQLAAYGHADFIGRPGDATRYTIPKIEQYGVLHLRPEGYELIPFAVTADTFAAFLHALALHRWREGEAMRMVGQPLPHGPAIGDEAFQETWGTLHAPLHAPAKETAP